MFWMFSLPEYVVNDWYKCKTETEFRSNFVIFKNVDIIPEKLSLKQQFIVMI